MPLSQRTLGYTAALLSSATFGLIPLFTVPLMHDGMATESILVYRFAFATLVVAMIMKWKGISFRETAKHLRLLLALSILYFCSAFFLINGYRSMPSGVATVIHFMYPIMVALLMLILFRQKLSKRTFFSLFMAFFGVVLISGVIGTSGLKVGLVEIGLVAFSGFCYATYIVVVNRSGVDKVPMWRFTFYIMLFSTLLFSLMAIGKQDLQLPTSAQSWVLLFLLGVVPTVISNIFLVIAIPLIGSTATSIMGVLEPLTAVIVGVVVLGEHLTPSSSLGIITILFAVAVQITSRRR